MPIDLRRPPPGDPRKVRIEQFVGTVVAMCPCGTKHPIVIPVVAGQGSGYQCESCLTIWSVEKIDYQVPPVAEDGAEQQPVKCHVDLKGTIPNIVGPGSMRVVG